MHPDIPQKIASRVTQAAEAALAQKQSACVADVLVGIGWLSPSQLEEWRRGEVDSLERVIQAGLGRVSAVLAAFQKWGESRGLKPGETVYVSHTRDRHALRFSLSGDPSIERAYSMHFISPELTEAKRERLAEKLQKPADLVVFDPVRDWKCGACGASEGFLFMEADTPLCLACADLDELVSLPRGDTALTRRSRKYSRLSAVVVRFSRARKRYERQGVLVEREALDRAEAECLGDADARARQRGRAEERRAGEDETLALRMRDVILGVFPSCPPPEAEAIARHTAVRGSGRVGRTAAGQALDEGALTLAVAAYVRHRKTPYDELLMSGVDRSSARAEVRDAVQAVLDGWRRSLA